jgi:hypothetical protein
MPWGDAVRRNAGLFFIAYTKVRCFVLARGLGSAVLDGA